MQIPIFPGVLLALCAVVCMVLILFGLGRVAERRTVIRVAVVLAGWLVLMGVLALRGFFSDFSKLPPRPGFVVLLPLPFVLWIAFSKRGGALLRVLPPQWPIYLQSFRVVVEIALWWCVRVGALPVQMSFEGRNFDILTGLFAVPVGYYCFVKRSAPGWVAVLYNILGLLLLLNVVVIAVLSMPTPLRVFHNEPANTLVGYFPFIYLPGVLVPLAYTLHIFSLRQRKNSNLAGN